MAEFWHAPFASGGAEVPPGPGVPANVWFDPRSAGQMAIAMDSTTFYGSVVSFTPYLVTETLTFDRVACLTSGVTTGSANAYLGIYASDPDTRLPGNLFQYFGEVSSTITTSTPRPSYIDIDLTLEPGMYWRAIKLSAGIGRWFSTTTGWAGSVHYPWNRFRNFSARDEVERNDARYWSSGFQSTWTSTANDPLPPNAADESLIYEWGYRGGYTRAGWSWPSNTGPLQWQALRVVT